MISLLKQRHIQPALSFVGHQQLPLASGSKKFLLQSHETINLKGVAVDLEL